MHFLIAPDKFKDALSAQEAAEALQQGIQAALPSATFTLLPLADGGEGFAEMMSRFKCSHWQQTPVRGPLMEKVKAGWGYNPETHEAFLELAAASGLQLLNAIQRNPLHTTTFGTGQLIAAALQAGAKKITLGLGGSATNDGGCGIAAALGYRFLNKWGKPIPHPCGKHLRDIYHIDASQRNPLLNNCHFTAACDVQNPLLGPSGATYTFARQKGAKESDLPLLEEGLESLARVIKRDIGIDIRETAGGGAAGGAGAGTWAFLNASLQSGTNLILESSGFIKQLRQATYLISGEGRFDESSLKGKLTGNVCELAKNRGIPAVVFCGSSGFAEGYMPAPGIEAVIAVSDKGQSLPKALQQSRQNLREAAYHYFSQKNKAAREQL